MYPTTHRATRRSSRCRSSRSSAARSTRAPTRSGRTANGPKSYASRLRASDTTERICNELELGEGQRREVDEPGPPAGFKGKRQQAFGQTVRNAVGRAAHHGAQV